MKDCVGHDINEGDFVIYVVQGDRNAGINFGWVVEIVDKSETSTRPNGTTYRSTDIKVKIQRADADGTRHTVQAVDVPGHWRDDVPMHDRTWDKYAENYVSSTMRDTGKPSTTRLNARGEQDYRLLVTKPL